MPSTPESVTLVIEDGQGSREQHTVDGPGDPIRVAVGRPGRRSAVWNIMANKNKSDIYVAARSVARVQKVSLHESGDWRVQWVDSSEAGRRMAELTGSRIQDQWRRPAETSPGWTKVLSIWIPDGEVVDMPNDYQTEEGVIWVPPPAPFNTRPRGRIPRRRRAPRQRVHRVPRHHPAGGVHARERRGDDVVRLHDGDDGRDPHDARQLSLRRQGAGAARRIHSLAGRAADDDVRAGRRRQPQAVGSRLRTRRAVLRWLSPNTTARRSTSCARAPDAGAGGTIDAADAVPASR